MTMTNIRVMLAAVIAAFLLSACNGMGMLTAKPNAELTSGIKSYENFDYPTALASLQKSLAEMGKSDKAGQVTAHKYLAFIHCVSGRTQQCHDEFRKALDIDPAFDLKPAEAGHPIWGPVFRSEKAKQAK